MPLPARPALAAALLAALLSACQRAPDVAALQAQARQYAQRGEYKSAVIQLKNALQRAPQHAGARRQLGATYLGQGDALSAEKELRRALELGAPAVEVGPLLGKALLQQGRYQDVLDGFPADGAPLHLVLRAEAQIGLGRADQARTLFEQALARDPRCAPALLGQARFALAANQTEAAAALVDRALAAHPDDADSLRLRGDVLRVAGKRAEAIAAYRRLLAIHPGFGAARIDLANLLSDAAQFDAARTELNAARATSAPSLALLLAQAMLDYRQGKPAAALDSLQQILRVAPEHGPSLLLTGAVELALNSLPLAEQHLRQFLAQAPGHGLATRLLAQVQVRQHQPEAALVLLAPLLEQHPDDVELLALAGEANLRANRNAQAAALFERAGALQPRQPLLQAAAGLSRLREGDTARAVAELERAASLGGATQRASSLLVMSYLGERRFDQALAAVERMEREADGPDVQNLKGGVYLARQDLARARASFERALALDPAHQPSLDNLANLDLLERHPERARARYQAALAKAPANAALLDALARLALRTGRAAEAGEWLERASRAAPDDLARGLRLVDYYVRSGAGAKAVVLAQRLQGSHPADADALGMLARAQQAAGDLDGMAASYGKLAALLPGAPEPLLHLARAQQDRKDLAGAVASVRKALNVAPDSAEATRLLVVLLSGQKRYPEALAAARQAQQRHPDLALGFRLEGDLALARNQPAQAAAAYTKAFALQPGSPGLILLHTALEQAGRTAAADAQVQKWLDRHADDLSVRLYYASARLLRRDFGAARTQLEAALALAPDNVVALNDFAWVCQQLGDARALPSAEKAHRLAPASPVVLDTLAWIRHAQGADGTALPLLRRAVSLAPEAGNIRYHLGVVLAATGDKDGARRELQQVLGAGGDPARSAAVRSALAAL